MNAKLALIKLKCSSAFSVSFSVELDWVGSGFVLVVALIENLLEFFLFNNFSALIKQKIEEKDTRNVGIV